MSDGKPCRQKRPDPAQEPVRHALPDIERSVDVGRDGGSASMAPVRQMPASSVNPELLLDAIFGPTYYRLVLRLISLTEGYWEKLIDQVLGSDAQRNGKATFGDGGRRWIAGGRAWSAAHPCLDGLLDVEHDFAVPIRHAVFRPRSCPRAWCRSGG